MAWIMLLTGVFDPPPDQLATPWFYVVDLVLAKFVSIAIVVSGAHLDTPTPQRTAVGPMSTRIVSAAWRRNLQMNVLLIDDDAKTSAFVKRELGKCGHVVATAVSGRAGLLLSAREPYDVMIVDRMLPGLDGLGMVKTVRAVGVTTPVLFLTTMGGIEERVEGLEAGDDYLVKPFAFAELLARIHALVRRPPMGHGQMSTLLKGADLEMNLVSRKVRRGDQEIDLQRQEFRLLEYPQAGGDHFLRRKAGNPGHCDDGAGFAASA
jgi:two-component system, OmpR family, response regulator